MVTELPPARILKVEPDAYLKLPGFSPSLANVLLTKCALVARAQYQRNLDAAGTEDDADDEESSDDQKDTADKQKRLEQGSVLHALLLGKGKRIATIPDEMLSGKNRSVSSAAAKAFRDDAIARGMLPVKEPAMERYERAASEIRTNLAAAGHVLDGTSEFAIEWWEPSRHGPVQCRTMLDHIVTVNGADAMPLSAFVYELKFPVDASPDRTERTSDTLGYPIAAAARLRALNALWPSLAGRIEYRYLCCEPHRPYAFWDPTPMGRFLEYGKREWLAAVNRWGEAMTLRQWTSYHQDNGRREIDLPRYRKMQEGIPLDDE